jgi:SsrA-binding protein
MTKKQSVLVVCSNRKAYHDYFIETDYEAGLSLLGAEVKSIRQKEVSLEGSFVRVEDGRAYVYNMHVKPYKFNSLSEPDPTRPRELLLTRKRLLSYLCQFVIFILRSQVRHSVS